MQNGDDHVRARHESLDLCPQYGIDFHEKAAEFVKNIAAEKVKNGRHVVGIATQVFAEFINVITRQTIEKPLSLADAILAVEKYLTDDFKDFTFLKVVNPLQ